MAREPSGPLRVAVIGAGVIGLSVAVHLTEKLGSQVAVTVIADKFSPETTSDKTGAIFLPIDFSSGGTTGDTNRKVHQWTRMTFDLFNQLYSSSEAAEVGLCLMTGYDFRSSYTPDPWWKGLVYGFRQILPTAPEARLLHIPSHCKTVWVFTTYILNCRSYLPWLTAKLQRNGVAMEKRRVRSLNEPELCRYDLVINCVGMGAHSLLGDDSLVPVRGQAVLVDAPWVKHFLINYKDKDSVAYILPRAKDVLLGGTAQDGNWSEAADEETSQEIFRRCEELLPSLRNAPVVGSWAGLRPVRNEVRLEMERFPASSSRPPVVHCYGHGGQGIVLHWGCALEVAGIVEQYIMGDRIASML